VRTLRILLLISVLAILSGLSGLNLAKYQIAKEEKQAEIRLLEKRKSAKPSLTLRTEPTVSLPLRPSVPAPPVSPPINWAPSNEKSGGKWQVAVDAVPRLIRVDRALQRLFVYENGKHIFTFKCSTSVTKKVLPLESTSDTPHDHVGVFTIQSKELNHFSKKYRVDMPYALQFWSGHYIHATSVIGLLGRPASHGCVRLHPKNAKILFNFARVGDVVEIR